MDFLKNNNTTDMEQICKGDRVQVRSTDWYAMMGAIEDRDRLDCNHAIQRHDNQCNKYGVIEETTFKDVVIVWFDDGGLDYFNPMELELIERREEYEKKRPNKTRQ